MVDSFPSSAADSDREIQLVIHADLENSMRVLAQFDKDYPIDPTAHVRTLITRNALRPRAEARYPLLAASQDRHSWLMPLLRRFVWSASQGDAGARWLKPICEMLDLVSANTKNVTPAEFVALTESRDALSPHFTNYLTCMAGYAAALEKTGPIDREVSDALRQLVRHCDSGRGTAAMRARFVWPLFRSGSGFEESDRSWSARLRRNMSGVPIEIFHCEPHAACGASGALSRKCRSAIQRIGKERLEHALRGWIGMVGEVPLAGFSPTDVILLGHVILLCDALEGPPCDQLLYAIACGSWSAASPLTWMPTYFWVLGRRPQDKVFACLEALMMNPVTATPHVRQQYEALLAAFGASAISRALVGVDGFPLDADPALAPHHTRLDQLLRMAESAAAAGPYVHPSAAAHLGMLRSTPKESLSPAAQAAMKMWEAQLNRPLPFFPVSPEVTSAREAMEKTIFEEFSTDPSGLHRAVVARVEWIAAHKDEYPKDTLRLWDEWLNGLGGCGGLKARTMSRVNELSLESLLATIRTGGGNTKVLELCQTYVAKHGWHADLVPAFRQWIGKIGNAMSDLTYRWRAEAFLWFEDVAPIDPGACWSHRVKQDLRAMKAEEAAAWRALLENTTWVITDKPPMKWMKAAEAAFQKVGRENFRRRFKKWSTPFGENETLRLTIAGRNILRILIWYCLVAKDPQVDEALLGFVGAKWKTKDDAKRAAQPEMAFSYVLSQRAPDTALPILEDLVRSGQAFKDSATHRTYLQLCAKKNREPIDATPQATMTSKPKSNPILDKMTIADFQSLMDRKKRS